MNRISKTLTIISNGMIFVSLSAMCIFVFTNVILRYIFGTGIPWAEELSRYFFVWLVFIGATMALKNKAHLSVDILTNVLPLKIQKLLLFISNLLVLYVLWMILDGSWKMTIQNLYITAPATGLPMYLVYGVGIVMSIGMGVIVIVNTINLFRKKYIND